MDNNTEDYNDDCFDFGNNIENNDDHSNTYPDIEDLQSRIEDLEGNQGNIVDYSRAIFIYIPGLVLAMILSYSANQSILWAILQGYLSWIYVIYNAFS